ncbi:unnamed protein product [Prunus armeniaca]
MKIQKSEGPDRAMWQQKEKKIAPAARASPGKWTPHCPSQHLSLEWHFGLSPPLKPEPEWAAGTALKGICP